MAKRGLWGSLRYRQDRRWSVAKVRLGVAMISLIGVAVALALLVGSATVEAPQLSSLGPAASTYSVAFHELGLASGTSWSVTFNGVLSSSTTATITFTGISSGSYSWSVTSPLAVKTGIQYVTTTTSGSMSVPDQLSQWVVFEKQYEVSFADSPSTSAGYTSPESPTWYDSGSVFVITAFPYTGYAFSAWSSSSSSLAISVKSVESTMITVGTTGTITATFKVVTSTVTFSEVGIPSGAAWEIDFNGATSSATAPASITLKGVDAGDYSWNAPAISGGTGVEYAAAANGATFYSSIDVPFQTTQSVVYTKQFQVTFADSPSSDGYTLPESTAYYTNGTNLAVTAVPYDGFVFSTWTSSTSHIFIESTTSQATNVTVRGTGTLTANFVSGSPSCTVCTVTFREIGLPAGTAWGVEWNETYYGSTSSTLSIPGQSAGDYYWYATNPIASKSFWVSYAASPTSDYLYLPYSTSQVIVYSEQVYVQFVNSPYYSGSTSPSSAGWYPLGSQLAVSAVGTTYWSFSKWSTNTTKATIAKSTLASTTVTLGAPATITATFVQPVDKVTFVAFGLAKGTSWGLEFNYVDYFSDTAYLNISNVPTGSWYWYVLQPTSAGANGAVYEPTLEAADITVPTQTYQALAFQEQFYVTLAVTPSGAGSTSPYGAAWYTSGTILAISAINSSGSFESWSSTSSSLAIASASSASTTLTITGTGTVTAKFS